MVEFTYTQDGVMSLRRTRFGDTHAVERENQRILQEV